MNVLLKKSNIIRFFYLSLIIQIVWRIIILLFHELLYNGIGYLPVYGGGVWIFLLLPFSLTLYFLVVKKSDFKVWLKPLILFTLTIIIVLALGFVHF